MVITESGYHRGVRGSVREPRTAGGTWAYRIDLGSGPGGRHQKQVAGFRSREEAEAALARALVAQGGGDPNTVAGFLERIWLPARRAGVERSTFDQYAWAVRRHIVPVLGAMQLGDLTPMVLDRWLVRLGAGDRTSGAAPLGATSVRLVRKVLSMACEDAVDRGYLAGNPLARVAVPPPAPSGQGLWTVPEARRFLSVASSHRLAVAFHLALVSDLRRGELLALRWSDVDAAEGRLRVAQHLVVEGGRARLKPVPAAARRTVPLSPRMVGMLVEHQQRQDRERASAGDAWRGSNFVLCTPVGGWVSPECFSRVLDDLLAQAGVRRITPDGLRRTARALADAERDLIWRRLDEVLAP